jgi:hypothetical protein
MKTLQLLSFLGSFNAKKQEKERLVKAYGENYFVELKRKGRLRNKIKGSAWVVSSNLPGYEAVLTPNFKY